MPRDRAPSPIFAKLLRAALASTAIAALLAGAPAQAANPPAGKPDAAALAAAKTHFTAGLKLYKEGSVREALAEFLLANKIVPRASVLKNIAQCYRDLHDLPTAYAKYGELLTTYGASMKPAEVDELKRVVAELGGLTGTITIKVAEPGATVTIDDKDVGATPVAAPLRVSLGAHRVVITKPGFDTLTKAVEIQGGDDAVVDAALAKEITTGHLVVTAPGADASVRLKVDGREVGPAPWEADLPPGPHEIAAEGDASRAAPERVELARAARLELPIKLKPRTGHVMVDPRQADAVIKVDGMEVGTGVWEGDVKIGRHDVTVDAPGFLTYKRALLVHDDERLVDSAVLKAAPRDERLDYVGVYGGFNLGLSFQPSPNDEYSVLCNNDPTHCDHHGPAIAPFTDYVNVGYNFGWLGIEAVGLFRLDITDVQYAFADNPGQGRTGPARSEHMNRTRFLGAGGLGGRITSKGSTARFTFGTAFLVGREGINANIGFVTSAPQYSCAPGSNCDNSSESAHKTVPLLLFDGGLMLGSTPGVRFKLGAVALVEFAGDVVAESGASSPRQSCTNSQSGPPVCTNVDVTAPPIHLAQGAQFFVGPVIGLQFGH